MKRFSATAFSLLLCLLTLSAHALPLSMMPQRELKALPDEVLEKSGRYRVKAGDTLYRLAKRAGLGVEDFRFYQRYDAELGSVPERLPVGAILTVGNPVETSKITKVDERYSVHEYEYLAQAKRKEPDLAGNRVLCYWSVAWPESGCGLSEGGLESLRDIIASRCFNLTSSRMDEVVARYRKTALQELEQDISRWEFSAKAELSWPFGTTRQSDEWYRRPVIVLKNEGYENNGGNGCHSYVSSCVISIPDGRELTERDYFREDALDEVAALVGRRMVEKFGEPQFGEKNPRIRKGADCCMTVSREGMTWWVEPYALYSGATGVANVTIPWSDLKPFSK